MRKELRQEAMRFLVVVVACSMFLSVTVSAAMVRMSHTEVILEIRSMKPDEKTIEELKQIREDIIATGAANAEDIAARLDAIIEGS